MDQKLDNIGISYTNTSEGQISSTNPLKPKSTEVFPGISSPLIVPSGTAIKPAKSNTAVAHIVGHGNVEQVTED
jgi:hypothetical protein